MNQPPRRTVLVVDDEAAILRLLTKSLEPLGYDVVTADNRKSAEAALLNVPVDAMILDLRLTHRSSGLELLAFSRQRDPLARLPILMLTGVMKMTQEEEDSIRYHRAYVFYKPVRIDDIANALDRLLSPPYN